jgi:MFS transporter, DHA2 family, methylenomycin A resistance protein
VNNTARQAGGVVGIAIYGALAGPPTATDDFLAGFHTAALITSVLFVVAAVTALTALPTRQRPA